jgi:single-strand DNA-binding protein
MYQRFIAVGRLGRDPEVSTTTHGGRMATMSLATSDYVKGEERTEWHRIVIWDEKLVEVIERRARKGTLVAVEGQIRTRKWQKDGREMASTEVVLDRFNSRLQILSGSRPDAETGEPSSTEANTPLFDKRFQFDELPF